MSEVIHASQGYVDKTARQIAIEEVAKIVAGAPESLDTLKEIAELIANGDTGIQALFDQISTLKDLVANKADTAKLHALTPEVTDSTVTLKPEDGKANWVDGKVEVTEVRRWGRVYASSALCSVDFRDVDGGYHGVLIHPNIDTYELISVEDQYNVSFLTVKMPSTCSVFDSMTGETIGTIPAGTVFSIECDGGIPSADETPDMQLSVKFYYSSMFEFVEWQGIYADMQPTFISAYGYVDLLSCVLTPVKFPVVTIPASTDTTKARWFSLAIETDAEPEKAVEWQGGEVIEAFPGASKLVPGLNVWDVAEVAPGKFKVERASSPAQSAPLTLTAPNGRVAELTVGDDLVLEVKEK